MAVVFAMLASYGISRTLTPIIIRLLLRKEHEQHGEANRLARRASTTLQRALRPLPRLLRLAARRHPAAHAFLTPVVALCVVAGAGVLALYRRLRFLSASRRRADPAACPCAGAHPHRAHRANLSGRRGQDPPADPGPRISGSCSTISACRNGVYNLAFTDGSTIGVNDGQYPDRSSNEGHAPTADYIKKLRRELPSRFPTCMFYFQPADLVTQVLNFGVPSQIDVQVQGRDRAGNKQIAKELQQQLGEYPRPRRRARPAGTRCAGTVLYDRSHPRAAARAQHAAGRQQSQHQPELVGAGVAELLDRPEERHSLLFCRCRRRNTVSQHERAR